MAKSLKPYREAQISKTHMFWGIVLVIVMMVLAFIACSVPPLA